MKKLKTARQRDRMPGIILSLVFLAAEFAFLILLVYTGFLQPVYLLMLIVAILLVSGVLHLMVQKFRRRILFIIGCVFMAVILTTEGVLSFYIYKTVSSLDSMTGINTETAEINLYVKNSSDLKTLSEMEGKTLGILTELDRDHTDQALLQISGKTGVDIFTKEYPNLETLANALVTGECQGVLLNRAYLEVMEQLSGCSTFLKEIRMIDTEKIETVVERKLPERPIQSESTQESAVEQNHVYTVYISGIDTRGEMTASSLSDVNIILTVNTKTKQILMVSTPRDYYVPLSVSGGVPDKLTHAGIYGVNVCIDTLEMLYDIEVNYYFRINFAGFIKIIDALGGITIDSDYEFDTQNVKGYHFEKGANTVDGEQALAFSRERYAFADGDRQRGRDQMKVIRGILDKVMTGDFLKNYFSVLDSLEDCFETNVPYDLVSDLMQEQMKDSSKWSVFSYSTDGTGDTQQPYSMNQKAYVMIPDMDTVDKAKLLMNKVREDFMISEADVS